MSAPARRLRPPTIVERLRAETRPEHDAAERDLDWEARTSNRADYRDLLARLHAFHRAWEPEVARLVGDPAFTGPRERAHLLERDLDRLGSDAGARTEPPAFSGLPLATRAEALGSMYVLEGSTLGGQVIARRVRAVLDFDPLYHAAHGDRVGAMWRAFQARLLADVAPDGADEAVDAARRTFCAVRAWLAPR